MRQILAGNVGYHEYWANSVDTQSVHEIDAEGYDILGVSHVARTLDRLLSALHPHGYFSKWKRNCQRTQASSGADRLSHLPYTL